MEYLEMDAAIKEAERTISRAELYVNNMAKFLIRRLRKVNYWILCDLKRELKDFNAHTKEWK